MAKTSRLSTLLMFAAIHVGCSQVDYTTPQRYRKGLVICLSGAGGATGEVDRIRQGLDEGKVDYALEPFSWSRHEVISDQADIEENKRRARQLARRIETYQQEYPDRPVWLVGFSAGTGIVTWAVEDLQPDSRVRGVVLLASSLNAGYDLTRVLQNTAGKLHNFHSPADPVLGLGIPVAGSVDRQRTFTGGQFGFKPPADADQTKKNLYTDKLVQRSWQPGDVFEGHYGGHLGATFPAFIRRHVAPLIRSE